MTSPPAFTEDLRRLLHAREGVTGERAASIVTAIAAAVDRYQRERLLPDLAPGVRRWLTRLTRCVRALDECLDVVTFPMELEADRRELARQCGRLALHTRALERAARAAATRARPARGRRPDAARGWMEREIAFALFAAGVRPTIATDGTLGRIFNLAYAAIGLDQGSGLDAKTALRRACRTLPR